MLNVYLNSVVRVYILDLDFLHDNVCIPVDLLEYYVDLLQKANNRNEVLYIFLLMKYQLKVGDTIILNRISKTFKGRIEAPENSPTGQLMYRLIRKNGSVSSNKRILYRKSPAYFFYCEDRKFIEYNKIL